MLGRPTPRSVFASMELPIGRFLGVTPEDATLNRKSVTRLLRGPPAGSPDQLLRDMYDLFLQNRSTRSASEQNWRSERQVHIGSGNRSPEVLLERAIARLSEAGALPTWYNQVPVASGLVTSVSDKRAAVDLVGLADDRLSLVELKWGSDNPVFAAFEILRYGLAYLHAWLHRAELGYDRTAMLRARDVQLVVLGPREFYAGYDVAWLAESLDAALARFSGDNTNDGLRIGFSFAAFPGGFSIPLQSGSDVIEMRINGPAAREIIDAVSAIRTITATDW